MKRICEIKGLEKIKPNYYITTCGKVISYGKSKFNILKFKLDKGYPRLGLMTIDNKRKFLFIHRLVALAFIPNPNNLPQVNHIDETPSHSYVCNLEWCDCTYNINYGNHNAKVLASNLANKDISYYESYPIFRDDFKKRCKSRGLNFEDFDEVFSDRYEFKDRKVTRYFYFYKYKE